MEPWGFSLRELLWMADGHIDGIAAGIGKAFSEEEDTPQQRQEKRIPKDHKIVSFNKFKELATKQVREHGSR